MIGKAGRVRPVLVDQAPDIAGRTLRQAVDPGDIVGELRHARVADRPRGSAMLNWAIILGPPGDGKAYVGGGRRSNPRYGASVLQDRQPGQRRDAVEDLPGQPLVLGVGQTGLSFCMVQLDRIAGLAVL